MATVLGVALRLENNSHDHEERYRYSIGLQRNVHVGLRVSPDVVAMVAQSIGQLLADNLDVEVARETPKGVEIYSASRAD